jgi:hypothetical protein
MQMYKAKLCSFAIACMVGLVSISPSTAIATETTTGSVIMSEEKRPNDDRAAFEEKMKAAGEKWAALSEKQKKEVYSLLEAEMQSEFKLMDKLVNLGVMNQEDANAFKSHMQERLKKVKESGEFPLFRQKIKKDRK